MKYVISSRFESKAYVGPRIGRSGIGHGSRERG